MVISKSKNVRGRGEIDLYCSEQKRLFGKGCHSGNNKGAPDSIKNLMNRSMNVSSTVSELPRPLQTRQVKEAVEREVQ